MKKFLSLILTICLIFAGVGAVPVSAKKAAINDMSDVVALLKLVVSGEEVSDVYDLNGDGAVNAADVLIALKSFAIPHEPQVFLLEQRDSMLEGGDIDFNVGDGFVDMGCNGHFYNSIPYDIAIVKSATEWSKLGYDDSRKYPDSFYEENALIVLFVEYSSRGPWHTIDAMTIYGDELCVGTTTEWPDMMVSPMLTCTTTFIEVKKADVTNIEKITRFDPEI
jgi:hypothetical protein